LTSTGVCLCGCGPCSARAMTWLPFVCGRSYVADWQAVGTSGLPPEVPSDDVDSALDRGSHTYSAGSFGQGGGIGATTVIHQGTGYVEMY